MAALALVETEGGRGERLARQERAALRILNDLGSVLPPVDHSMVEVLTESMKLQGFFAHEPVVRYQIPGGPEVTIIGRHREAAAARAEVEPAVMRFTGDPVEATYLVMASVLKHRYLDMKQRLAVKAALDNAGFDWEQIARDRGLRVTRQQIEAELLEQAKADKPLNHRATARKLGMDFSRLRVDRACKALVSNGSLNHCPHRFTESGQEARGAKPQAPRPVAPEPVVPEPPAPAPSIPGPEPAAQARPRSRSPRVLELEGKVGGLLLADASRSNGSILAELGMTSGQHRIVERVRATLEAEGRIQAATARKGADGRTLRSVRQPDAACTHGCPVHCPEG